VLLSLLLLCHEGAAFSLARVLYFERFAIRKGGSQNIIYYRERITRCSRNEIRAGPKRNYLNVKPTSACCDLIIFYDRQHTKHFTVVNMRTARYSCLLYIFYCNSILCRVCVCVCVCVLQKLVGLECICVYMKVRRLFF
jgi:hypothetical protein